MSSDPLDAFRLDNVERAEIRLEAAGVRLWPEFGGVYIPATLQEWGATGVYVLIYPHRMGVYVGSTVNAFRKRHAEHLNDLRANRHRNPRLQNVFNLAGEADLLFVVLEVEQPSVDLRERERWWLDTLRESENYTIYNIATDTRTPIAKGTRRPEAFRRLMSERTRAYQATPEGRRAFEAAMARRNADPEYRASLITRLRLDDPAVQEKLAQHQRSPERIRRVVEATAETYAGFVSPAGMVYAPVVNLAEFCRTHGLGETRMRAVARGEQTHHKGWRSYAHGASGPFVPPPPTLYDGWIFVAPDGTQYAEIENVNAFCRAHDIHPMAMRKVIKGVQPSHKGWTAIRDPEAGGSAEASGLHFDRMP